MGEPLRRISSSADAIKYLNLTERFEKDGIHPALSAEK